MIRNPFLIADEKKARNIELIDRYGGFNLSKADDKSYQNLLISFLRTPQIRA
jgi:hypothetical protein